MFSTFFRSFQVLLEHMKFTRNLNQRVKHHSQVLFENYANLKGTSSRRRRRLFIYRKLRATRNSTYKYGKNRNLRRRHTPYVGISVHTQPLALLDRLYNSLVIFFTFETTHLRRFNYFFPLRLFTSNY